MLINNINNNWDYYHKFLLKMSSDLIDKLSGGSLEQKIIYNETRLRGI